MLTDTNSIAGPEFPLLIDFLIPPQTPGKDERGAWVSSHLVWTGGTGARPTKDGLSAMGFPARSQAVPVEVVEDRAPLVFLRKELRPDSAGAGRYRGGFGQTVAFHIDSDAPFLISPKCERTRYPARGLHGGLAGAAGEFLQGKTRPNPKRDFRLEFGEGVTLKLPGGGGYGDPLERDPEAVLRDVRNGMVNPEAAEEIYGVVLEGSGETARGRSAGDAAASDAPARGSVVSGLRGMCSRRWRYPTRAIR